MTLTFTRSEILRQLTSVHKMAQDHAIRALAIANQQGLDAETTEAGVITIRAIRNGKEQYSLDDGIPAEAVGRLPKTGYNNGERKTSTNTEKGRQTMPRGKAAAAPVQEVEGRDLSVYRDKEPTPKLVDYHEWLEQTLGIKYDLQSIYISVTLYHDFQRSDFNKTRTAERRAAKAAGNGTPEPEPASKPTRSKPGPKTGGTTGRRGAPAPDSATKRGRGRSKAEAPF